MVNISWFLLLQKSKSFLQLKEFRHDVGLSIKSLKDLIWKKNRRSQATAFEAGRFGFQKKSGFLKGERGRRAVVCNGRSVFTCVIGKPQANYDLTSETELEISWHVVQRFWSKKGLKKGPRDALRLLREHDGFWSKRALSLDRFEIASKNKIKLKKKV